MKVAVCYMGMSARFQAKRIAVALQLFAPMSEVVLYDKRPLPCPDHGCKDLDEWGADMRVYVEMTRGEDHGS